jgi:hypothetical protein
MLSHRELVLRQVSPAWPRPGRGRPLTAQTSHSAPDGPEVLKALSEFAGVQRRSTEMGTV